MNSHSESDATASTPRTARMSRLQLGFSLGIAAGLALGLGWFFLDGQDVADELFETRVPSDAAARAPSDAAVVPTDEPVPSLLSQVRDPKRTSEQRTLDLRTLVLQSQNAAPILELLDSLGPQDPHRAQMRAMLVSALARHPDDPGTRERLLALLQGGSPRDDRLLAVSTLGSIPDSPAWCVNALRPLLSDPDPQVRERTAGILKRN